MSISRREAAPRIPRIPGSDTDLCAAARLIEKTQKDDGEIPWHQSGKTDPWDHVEAAMGLSVAGNQKAARRAFEWLAQRQHEDGSWYAAYQDGQPIDKTRDTNLSTYIAVGVYHYYLVYDDKAFVEEMFDTVALAIDFALSLQAKTGEIYWAKSPDLKTDPMALLTGSSSIYMSIKCAIACGRILGIERPDWHESLVRLGAAIRQGYRLFNMAKSHYSMDWFYPVLCGAVTGKEAKKRIEQQWKKFIVEGMGVLCVSHQPWITIAETCELVCALAACGETDTAKIVFDWISERRFDDGSFWCGFTHPDMVIWPEEKITWTNAVVLLAADALYKLTPGASLFSHDHWKGKNIPS